jgi:hypothetical protein
LAAQSFAAFALRPSINSLVASIKSSPSVILRQKGFGDYANSSFCDRDHVDRSSIVAVK